MLRRNKLYFAPLAALTAIFSAAPFACTPNQLSGGTGGAGASGSTGVGGEVAQVGGGGSGGGCVAPGMSCPIAFTLPLNNQHTVELRGDFAPNAWVKGVHMSLDDEEWKASINANDGQQIQYKFFVDGTTWVNDPNNMNTVSDGNGGLNNVTVAMCPGSPCAPDGGNGGAANGEYDWRSALLYFVFVDRFYNGDPTNDHPIPNIETPANYQGGDYEGVLKKLDENYFDDLGVTALWITVPCNNTNQIGLGADGHNYSAYHGYWPDDCTATEEHFGSMTLLKKVVDTAHKHKMKVLLDYAMNHVYQDADVYTQHNDWFWPLDYNGKNCVCGDGCSWDDPYEQKRCWFEPYLPDWNYTVPEARAWSVNNAVSWITKTGVDGFRLDAVKHIEPTWITDLRTAVTNTVEPTSHQHFYMVGETFDSGNRDLIKSFISPTTELDGQFDFPLRGVAVENLLRRTGTMFDLDNFLATNDTYYDPGIMSTFLGNHDLLRTIMTALDQPWDAWSDGGTDAKWNNRPYSDGSLPPRSAYERMAVGFTFLLTTKGIPLIYYGDEIGMPGAGDPDNRRFMQWDGYSDDQKFLHDTIAALGKARQKHPALWKGVRVTKSVTQDTYAYEMTEGRDSVWVALNRGDTEAAVDNVPAKAKDLLTGKTVTGPHLKLPPRTSMVLVAE
jgi:glycosidase